MKEKIAVGALMLQLLGCVTTGKECVPATPSAGAPGAELVIYRPSNKYGSAVDWPMSIDDCIIGSLANGAFFRQTVVPGTHKIRAEKRALANGADGEISANLPANETTFLRYMMLPGPTVWDSAKGVFAITDRISAGREIPELRSEVPQQK